VTLLDVSLELVLAIEGFIAVDHDASELVRCMLAHVSAPVASAAKGLIAARGAGEALLADVWRRSDDGWQR
jgi:hypothetical protein